MRQSVSPMLAFTGGGKRKKLPQTKNQLKESTQAPQLVSTEMIFTDRLENYEWDARIEPEAAEFQEHMFDNERILESKYHVGSPQERLEELSLALSKVVDKDDYLYGEMANLETSAIAMQQNVEAPCQVENEQRNELRQDEGAQPLESSFAENAIKMQDISDFIDRKGDLVLDEGEAVSELEVYTIAFENALKLLENEAGTANVLPLLTKIKNYFINKAARKGQRMKAVEEANEQLDAKVIALQKDLLTLRAELEEKDIGLKEMNVANEEEAQKVYDLFTENNKLNATVEETKQQLEQQERSVELLKTENDDLSSQQHELNERIKHITAVSERLRQVSDQSLEKLHISEKKLQENTNELIQMQTRFKGLEQQNLLANERIQEVEKQLCEERDEFEQEKIFFLEKLYKYGEAPEQFAETYNVSVKEAVEAAVVLCADDAFPVLKRLGLTVDQVHSWRLILQNLNSSEKVADVLKTFSKDYEDVQEVYSREVQTVAVLRAGVVTGKIQLPSPHEATRKIQQSAALTVGEESAIQDVNAEFSLAKELSVISDSSEYYDQVKEKDELVEQLQASKAEEAVRNAHPATLSKAEISEVNVASPREKKRENCTAKQASLLSTGSPVDMRKAEETLDKHNVDKVNPKLGNKQEDAAVLKARTLESANKKPLNSLQENQLESAIPQEKAHEGNEQTGSSQIAERPVVVVKKQPNSREPFIRHNSLLAEPAAEVNEQQAHGSGEDLYSSDDEVLARNDKPDNEQTFEQKVANCELNRAFTTTALVTIGVEADVKSSVETLSMPNLLVQQNTQQVAPVLKISGNGEEGARSCDDFGAQVDFTTEAMSFLRMRINELTRKCEDANIMAKDESIALIPEPDFGLTAERSTTAMPLNIKRITSQDLQLKPSSKQLIPLGAEVHEIETDSDDYSSSFSVSSYEHDTAADKRLMKYVKETAMEKCVQAKTETINQEMQTERQIEEFIEFTWDKQGLNQADLDNFRVAEELKNKKDDVEVFRAENVVVDELKLKTTPKVGAFAERKALESEKSGIKLNNALSAANASRVEDSIANFAKGASFSAEEGTNTALIKETSEIPTFEEFFELESKNQSFAQVRGESSTLRALRRERQLAAIQDQLELESAHFELGIGDSFASQTMEVPKSPSRHAQMSRLKATPQGYVLPGERAQPEKDAQLVQKSAIPTYSDFVKTVVADQEAFTVSRVVRPSFLLLHPRNGVFVKQILDFTILRDLESFRIPHLLDRIYIKFFPDRCNGSLVVYPNCLASRDFASTFEAGEKSFLTNTIKYFQYLINQAHLMNMRYAVSAVDNIERQFGEQMFPMMGRPVKYLRFDAITRRDGFLPSLLTHLEEFSKARIQLLEIDNHRYIEIPLENIVIKPLNQTVKLIREILAEHAMAQVEYIESQNYIPCTQTTASAQRFFRIVPGEIQREPAESLAAFVLLWAQRRYGVRVLVQTLVWSLIANIIYYEYDNDEIYLFSRLLFDELQTDHFLLFEELRNSLALNVEASTVEEEHILVENVPQLVQALMRSWDPARQQAFVQAVYAAALQTTSNQDQPPETIDFCIFATMLLHAYDGFRKTAFEAAEFVYRRCAQQDNTFPELSYGGFQALMECILPEVGDSRACEMFYAFSCEKNAATACIDNFAAVHTEENADSDTLVPASALADRRMSFLQFQDMFESFQLARFIIVDSNILDKLAGTELKRLVKNFVLLFNNYRGIVEQSESLFGSASVIKRRRIAQLTNTAQCDILAYDFSAATESLAQALFELTTTFLDCKPECSLIMLGGTVNALLAYQQAILE